MTNHNNEEVLELAKKHGLLPDGELPTSPVEKFVDYQDLRDELLAFATALSEKDAKLIAMLVGALEAQERLSRTGLFYAKPGEIESVAALRRQALTAAQPTAEAFIARVEARAEARGAARSLEEAAAAAVLRAGADWELYPAILHRMAAEKRKQAEQGKEG